MKKHVCPWWFAYTFDNPLRRLFHKPADMFRPYLHEGMTAVDLGCGMGFFSIGMASMVGDAGQVIAVDLQQEMLDILMKRARRAGVENRIRPLLCTENDIALTDEVDFALSFWMAHETPHEAAFVSQVYAILRTGGFLFLSEPKGHVPPRDFNKTLAAAQELGMELVASPPVAFSRAAVLIKR